MSRLGQRAWFYLCLGLGQMLRGGRYATVHIVHDELVVHVRKQRAFYAPLLVLLGGPLMHVLKTGVQVLRQCDWEQRERALYLALYHRSIQIEQTTLVLPFLNGVPLSALLDDAKVGEDVRRGAITLAAVALGKFHGHGLTHGDAMAENVLVDFDRGVANWFDFETVHDTGRSQAWCRGDDVRALLSTVLLRTMRAKHAETLQLLLDAYDDTEVRRYLALSFTTAFERPLVFHLGQAPLSFRCYHEIARMLRARLGDYPPTR